MSATNGHLPEGAVIATLDMLQAVNTKLILAPSISVRSGVPTFVRVKPIRYQKYRALCPPPPPGSEAWPATEYPQHREAWLKSLPHEERLAREAADDAIAFKVLSACLVEPPYSDEVGEWLFDDVDAIAREILVFSNIFTPLAKPEPEPAAEVVS